jgi:hypothetical protein
MIGSSLKANAVAHSSGKVHGKAIPRREADPEPDIYVDRPLSGPDEVKLWRFEEMRGIALGALSAGDRFTTRLSRRLGLVLAQGRAPLNLRFTKAGPKPQPDLGAPRPLPAHMAPVTVVRFADGKPEDTAGRAELASSIMVTPGWWSIEQVEVTQ